MLGGIAKSAFSSLKDLLQATSSDNSWKPIYAQPSQGRRVSLHYAQAEPTRIHMRVDDVVDTDAESLYRFLMGESTFQMFFTGAVMQEVMKLEPPTVTLEDGEEVCQCEDLRLYHSTAQPMLPTAVRDCVFHRLCLKEKDGVYAIVLGSYTDSSLPDYPSTTRGQLNPSGIVMKRIEPRKTRVSAVFDCDLCGSLSVEASILLHSASFTLDLARTFLTRLRNEGETADSPIPANVIPSDEYALMELIRATSRNDMNGWQPIATDEGFKAYSRAQQSQSCALKALLDVDSAPLKLSERLNNTQLLSLCLPSASTHTVLEDLQDCLPSTPLLEKLSEEGYSNIRKRVLHACLTEFEYCLQVTTCSNEEKETSLFLMWSVDHPLIPESELKRANIAPCGFQVSPKSLESSSPSPNGHSCEVTALLRVDLPADLETPFASSHNIFLQSFVKAMRSLQKPHAKGETGAEALRNTVHTLLESHGNTTNFEPVTIPVTDDLGNMLSFDEITSLFDTNGPDVGTLDFLMEEKLFAGEKRPLMLPPEEKSGLEDVDQHARKRQRSQEVTDAANPVVGGIMSDIGSTASDEQVSLAVSGQPHISLVSQPALVISPTIAPATHQQEVLSAPSQHMIQVTALPVQFGLNNNVVQRVDAQVAPTTPQLVANQYRRGRLVWTDDLHAAFVAAVEELGIDTAKPQPILKMMNVSGLTADHIKSHLQKYRAQVAKKKAEEEEKKRKEASAESSNNVDDLLALTQRVAEKAGEFSALLHTFCQEVASCKKSVDKKDLGRIVGKIALGSADDMVRLSNSLERFSQSA